MISRFFILALLLAACGGPGRVEFTDGQCLVDGHRATLPEVEARQSLLTERILSRQPLFVLVTVLVVLLAGASHLEKVVLLFRTRGTPTQGLGERLRLALDRYRDRPVRYFSMVIATLLLLGIAGGFYVYLDADKRASERALGLLQFCHLALRNGEAETILNEQRHNLESIESTAGNIRALVDKLPPAEQAKAKEIVDRIGLSLAKQGKLVNEYLAKTDQSTKDAQQHRQLVERGLSSLEASVVTLKTMPQAMHELSDQIGKVDGKVGASQSTLEAKIAALDAKVAALKTALDARPEPKCVACPAAEPPKPAVHPAPVTPPATKAEPVTKP